MPEAGFDVSRADGLRACYRALVPAVFAYLLRLTGGDRATAEDLTQETFLALVREAERGRLTQVDPGWLTVVARRKFLDHLRRRHREFGRLERAFLRRAGAEVATAEPDWDAVGAEEALALLGALPGDQRAALVLRYVDDLPTAEVARLLGRSVAAAESLLARARRRLARLVEEADRG